MLAIQQLPRVSRKRGVLAGDRVYSQALPQHFALPARSLGYQLVLDYKKDQLGRQGSHDGALLVDGRWYCPALPEALITATLDRREGRIDEDTWRLRVAERVSFEMRPNGEARADGSQRYLCPAAGAAPTARCDHKPRSMQRRNAGKRRVDLNHHLVNHPPKVCRQQSITVPAEAGDRFQQALRHGSAEWAIAYKTHRNSNEGGNGIAKDPAYQDISEASRRRIRGQAANAFITSIQYCAVNLRQIRSDADKVREDDAGAHPSGSRSYTATTLPPQATRP